MKQEIERKFLVTSAFQDDAIKSFTITQGFLSTHPDRVVRIRIAAEKGWLTIKGRASDDGLTRSEWEREIPVAEALQLLELCRDMRVEKERYLVPVSHSLTFEVDVFKGLNKGLVVAEIELPSIDTPFEKPEWLGKEVTGKVAYYNVMLAQNPFRNW